MVEIVKHVLLTQGFSTVVDDADYARVAAFNWYAARTGGKVYATRKVGGHRRQKTVLLHRWLLDAPLGVEVDHADGDPLNNQRSNLRFATRSQQTMNSCRPQRRGGQLSPYKGVYFERNAAKCARGRQWRARIKVAGVRKSLGLFATPEEAAHAYNEAALKYYGEFARLNEVASG